MAEWIDTVLAGEPMRLCADRALYWPARRRLLVADVHLGKDDAFRAAGIALPAGGSRHDLERLSALIERHGASSLWVLGDLLHGRLVHTRWREDWARFRARHAGLEIELIEGNHDRAAARAGLDIGRRTGPVDDGPFRFDHAPLKRAGLGTRFGICGHVHPVVHVPGFRGRFPAFAVVDRQLVLPAFSVFTGGWPVARAQARYACMGPQLLAMGPRGAGPGVNAPATG
jgi:DNA ligase-associated metallophosphoesterase